MTTRQRSPLIQSMAGAAGRLSVFVVVSILLLLGVKHLSDPLVSEAETRTLQATLEQVMPVEHYDNQPLQDTFLITDPQALAVLGSDTPVTVYRARQSGQPTGLILTAIAPNGYGGRIHLLIGIKADGTVSGVRVLKHRETPGLGDKIELSKSPWILAFNGRSLDETTANQWAVKKDGGDFDQFTGATITPRAVVQTVKRTLEWVNQQGRTLYE